MSMFFVHFRSSAQIEVTVDFLIEVDKLVQLIESPIFTCKNAVERRVCSAEKKCLR